MTNFIIVIHITVIGVTIIIEANMRFFGREEELKVLNQIDKQSGKSGKMTVITGRRRIGKTSLAMKFATGKKHLYLFVSKKSEYLLCQEYLLRIREHYQLPIIGEIKQFRQVFEILLQQAEKDKLCVIIDEFQEFFNINPAVYSELQDLWDRYKNTSKIHLIFIGSIYSLMKKIFENQKEPLFGRADRMLYLRSLKVKTIKLILEEYDSYSLENLFVNYCVTGGVPKYIEILADNDSFSKSDLFDLFFQKNSPFLQEGKNVLIEELGKEYGVYFSILELIASSKTSRVEIESILERNVGGYLSNLEKVYEIITKIKPFDAKPSGRIQKYAFKDNFLAFWFRFIFKHRSTVEIENFIYLKRIVERDFSTFSGPLLEKLFRELIGDTFEYSRIGNYWEKGNQNEIDIVAINELDKKLLIAEVKLNADRINISKLKHKSAKIIQKYPYFKVRYKSLSLKDIESFLI